MLLLLTGSLFHITTWLHIGFEVGKGLDNIRKLHSLLFQEKPQIRTIFHCTILFLFCKRATIRLGSIPFVFCYLRDTEDIIMMHIQCPLFLPSGVRKWSHQLNWLSWTWIFRSNSNGRKSSAFCFLLLYGNNRRISDHVCHSPYRMFFFAIKLKKKKKIWAALFQFHVKAEIPRLMLLIFYLFSAPSRHKRFS